MPHRDSDSDTVTSSRRKRKKRRTRSSSSSSDDLPERYRRKRKGGHSSHEKSRRRRSRSNSSSRYSTSKTSRKHRSGSRHRRSRSWSPGARKRSRTPKHRPRRSRSSSGSRRRSGSSSDTPRRSSKASPAISPKRVRKPGDPVAPKTGNESDQLKQKIQQVIKAAGTSGGQGAAAAGSSPGPTVLEQMERARLIEDINAPSFSQQAFVSRRDQANKKEASGASKEVDNHAAAIFGSFESLVAAAKEVVPLSNWREKPELLIHDSLREAAEVKMERWRKKLAAERRKRLNGATGSGLVRADM
ncbi:uncharacterized protein LOC144169213 isoform X2 [Haemaphysalis longicornis]